MSVTWLALGYSFFHIHLHQVWLWHLRLGSWLLLDDEAEYVFECEPLPPYVRLASIRRHSHDRCSQAFPIFHRSSASMNANQRTKMRPEKEAMIFAAYFRKRKCPDGWGDLSSFTLRKLCLWHLIFSQECITGNLFILFVASWGVLVLSLLCIRGVCVRGIPLCHQDWCA